MAEHKQGRAGINAFTLKIIAAVTMIIDHVTYLYVSYQETPNLYLLGRGIGRLSFPIFCFLLTEGYYYTGSRVKYAVRLAVSAVISEIAFDLAFYGKVFEMGHQNVMWTLLIGFLTVWIADHASIAAKIAAAVAGLVLAESIGADYGALGVAMILTFYAFRNSKAWMTAAIVIENVTSSLLQGAAAVSLIPIFFYNGKQGPKKYRYWFYLFYPGHLFLLYFLSTR